VGFAFVIMTVDDMGMPIPDYEVLKKMLQKRDDPQRWVNELAQQVLKGMKARVRQNVMFEYGLCIGSLGPERACVLVQKLEGAELEIPSAVLGHGYIPFEDDLSQCKEQITKELIAVKYRASI
jgi:predicted nucleotide-binding protein